MSNISDYINKYKDKTFKEVEFNEIDNLVFCMIVYLNFDGIVSNKRIYTTLSSAGNEYLSKYTLKDVSRYGFSKSEGYKILKSVVDSKRYKDVLVYNYVYFADNNKQFGAMSFRIKKNLIYIAFEGTDNSLGGWKEDFQMCYKFPVPSQEYAIKYLNKTIRFFDRNIIVGGHSKGGNLALAASMYCRKFLRGKIKKIYNNDGPGLRKVQIDSNNYKKVRERYIHIIPDYSYIGILLRNDKYKVVKSYKNKVQVHSVFTWMIDDARLEDAKLSNISKNFETSMMLWLESHDDSKIEMIITTIFKALEESNIYSLNDFINIKNTISVIKKLKNIDEKTKVLILDLIYFNFNYLINNRRWENKK